MGQVAKTNRLIFFTLLLAVLVLPSGINNEAVANTGFKSSGHTIGFDNQTVEEEGYSIAGIEFLRWI